MLEVTLSEQYQIAIPQKIIDSLNLQVGQKFIITVQGNSILLIPKQDIEEATILLDPDVKPYFADSQAVNHALRTLINLVRSPTPL